MKASKFFHSYAVMQRGRAARSLLHKAVLLELASTSPRKPYLDRYLAAKSLDARMCVQKTSIGAPMSTLPDSQTQIVYGYVPAVC